MVKIAARSLIDTYAVEFSETGLFGLSDLLRAVGVLKHVESVNDIKLDFAEVAQVVGVLLATGLSAPTLLHLLQLHVDVVLD